ICTEAEVPIEIKCRGNSTYSMPDVQRMKKFSYKIKFSEKVNLFGMGESKHWALLANFYEPTFLRNKMGYELGRMLGLSYTDSTFAVVYLNGEYRGLYQVCEAIAREKNFSQAKVDEYTNEMKTDLSWVTTKTFKGYKIDEYYDTSKFDITSGYLIEFDSFNDKPSSFQTSMTRGCESFFKINSPEYACTNDEMFSYVKDLFASLESALSSEDFTDSEGNHYSKFIDMDSLIDFFIQQTICCNGEFGIRSMYYYVDKGKIYVGPVWDLDCGAGNHMTVSTNYREWNGLGNRNQWYQRLYADPYFTALVQERMNEIYECIDNYESAAPLYYEYIKEEANKDYNKYGSHGSWGNQERTRPFEREYSDYLTWLGNRVQWVKDTFAESNLSIAGKGTQKSDKISIYLRYNNGENKLSEDDVSMIGYSADYKYDINSGSDIDIVFKTTHTSVGKAKIYINGVLYKGVQANNSKEFVYTISKDKLDLTDGKINTIVINCYNSTSLYKSTYCTFISSSIPDRNKDEALVECGDYYTVVKKGDTITVPYVDYTSSEMKAQSLSSNGKTYECGSEVKVSGDMRFTPAWERLDKFSVLTMEDVDAVDYKFAKDEKWYSTSDRKVQYEKYLKFDFESGVAVAGIQEKTEEGEVSLRLVGIADKDAANAGFYVKVAKDGTVNDSKVNTTDAYEKVYGNETEYETENGYFFTSELNEKFGKEDFRIEVTPYSKKNGEETKGTAYT
ncbi:MAG: CotH kinase family protein, partial [Clostridia bacterium]|nr:CotH kinase family protein [Clostridia bacterium]